MESGILYLIISLAHFFVWFGHDNFVIFLLAGMVSLPKTVLGGENLITPQLL